MVVVVVLVVAHSVAAAVVVVVVAVTVDVVLWLLLIAVVVVCAFVNRPLGCSGCVPIPQCDVVCQVHMMYDVHTKLYRQFLIVVYAEPARPRFAWYRWWTELAVRILPGSHDARLAYLETLRLQVWFGLLEALFHRRCRQARLGMRKIFSARDAHIVFRATVLALVELARRGGKVPMQYWTYMFSLYYQFGIE